MDTSSSKIAVVTEIQRLNFTLILPGYVLTVLDDHKGTPEEEKAFNESPGPNKFIWVKCEEIDRGQPFAIPLRCVKVIDDSKEIALHRILFR